MCDLPVGRVPTVGALRSASRPAPIGEWTWDRTAPLSNWLTSAASGRTVRTAREFCIMRAAALLESRIWGIRLGEYSLLPA